jgi:hypothetical protein
MEIVKPNVEKFQDTGMCVACCNLVFVDENSVSKFPTLIHDIEKMLCPSCANRVVKLHNIRGRLKMNMIYDDSLFSVKERVPKNITMTDRHSLNTKIKSFDDWKLCIRCLKLWNYDKCIKISFPLCVCSDCASDGYTVENTSSKFNKFSNGLYFKKVVDKKNLYRY